MDSLFSLHEPDPSKDLAPAPMMTNDQRLAIRSLFRKLNVTAAQRQFEVVAELTATRIRSVAELDAATAHRLIVALERRLRDQSRPRTGNSWADRDGDTWIDRL